MSSSAPESLESHQSGIGLLVRYGVEVRLFLNEATRAIVDGATVFHTVRESRNLSEYAEEFGVQLCLLRGLREKHDRWTEFFGGSRRARNRLKGKQSYGLYRSSRDTREMVDYLKGNWLTFRFLHLMKTRTLRRLACRRLMKRIADARIGEMWFSGYSSAANLSMAVSAKAAGCRTVCYINSWKDHYIDDHVPSVFDELRVWSGHMKEQYLSANGHLARGQVSVAGNPRLAALRAHRPVQPCEAYCSKYSIEADRFILYSAVNPRDYDREPEVVEMIIRTLRAAAPQRPLGILVKSNPMDPAPQRWDHLAAYGNVGIMRADWEWSRDEDFNVPSMESDREWFDLLHHCECTMNIASTVAVESLVCSKPVITIGFDHSGDESVTCLRTARSPFYRPLLERPDVVFAGTCSQIPGLCEDVLGREAGAELDDLVYLPN